MVGKTGGGIQALQALLRPLQRPAPGMGIAPEDLPADIINPTPSEHTPPVPGGFTINAEYRVAKEHFERIYFATLLSRTRGAVSEAAKQAGMSRRNLYEKIDRLSIDLNQFKR